MHLIAQDTGSQHAPETHLIAQRGILAFELYLTQISSGCYAVKLLSKGLNQAFFWCDGLSTMAPII